MRLGAVVEGRDDHALLAGIAAPGDNDNASDLEAVEDALAAVLSQDVCISRELHLRLENSTARQQTFPVPNLQSQKYSSVESRALTTSLWLSSGLVMGTGRGVRCCRLRKMRLFVCAALA